MTNRCESNGKYGGCGIGREVRCGWGTEEEEILTVSYGCCLACKGNEQLDHEKVRSTLGGHQDEIKVNM